MRTLITGADGQLGRELCRHTAARGDKVIATDVSELDILNAKDIHAFFRDSRPEVVFNAAAWTAVDAAEAHAADAFRVNNDGAANLATACEKAKIPLVHYSTDYVFDGTKKGAYIETDSPNPCSVYGRSKWASEQSVSELCERHLIFRTSWVFSAHGGNFVKTMLRLAREQAELGIVADQVGKPTSASALAEYSLIALSRTDPDWGTYHFAQPESASWHAFAEKIFKVARELGLVLKVEEVRPINTAAYPTAARRPENSVLDCTKFEKAFELDIPDWHHSLGQVIKELQRDGFFT